MNIEAPDWDFAEISKEEFLELRRDADGGSEAALVRFRAALQRNPGIVDRCGDLVTLAEQFICNNSRLPTDRTLAVIVAQKAEKLRQDLMAGSTSPIVRLCVDRVLSAWLEVTYLEIFHSNTSRQAPAVVNSLTKQKASVERRFHHALEALAKLRQLVETPGEPRRKDSSAVPEMGSVLGVIKPPAKTVDERDV
jgi:hypothetical protein